MNFLSTSDIQAPLDFVFAEITDFDRLERHGMRMGADVARADDMSVPGQGMMWALKADYRGKTRKIDLELVDYDPPHLTGYRAKANGFDAGFQIELVALSPNVTRMNVRLTVKATSLTAKLTLQSAKLAKSSLTKRFKNRFKNFSAEIEERFDRAQHA